MRILEVRRHTMRHKPELFVSAKGVTLAKVVGKDQFPFDLVVTSDLERAKQTAVHMGHNVDTTMKDLCYLPEAIFKFVGWPVPFSRISDVIDESEIIAEYAQSQADLWLSVLNQMPNAKNTLIITHGLIIELGMAACMPHAQHAEWGKAIGYCEGIRMRYEGTRFVDCEILRVPERYYNAKN